MSRRQLYQSASSFGSAARASSHSTSRFTCIYQQSRGLKYESYEERRQAAKEWAATAGQRYMRPRRGQTNYLQRGKGDRDAFTLIKAAQGHEGVDEEQAEREDDPWDDEKAVQQLKKDHGLSDEAINEHRQRHEGLTPQVLRRALAEQLEDGDIAEAIRRHQVQSADSQFDSNEVARTQASKLLAQRQQDGATSRPQDAQNLRPFPMNFSFQSQPVLSEELREMIYLKVVRDGLTVRTVSTLMGVGMERVGAVVRMKQMERDWVKRGKPLAVPYSRAVLDMLPTTKYLNPDKPQNKDRNGKPFAQPAHEPINELPVHPATTHQTFVSVPESRQFTRADAAKAFHPHLKSTDERIPHPELLAIEKFKLTGAGQRQVQAFAQRVIEDEKAKLQKQAEKEAKKEAATTKTYDGRWQFKFQDVSVEDVGKDGRSRRGVGWRYGMPHEDRKRGQVKIPTSVP